MYVERENGQACARERERVTHVIATPLLYIHVYRYVYTYCINIYIYIFMYVYIYVHIFIDIKIHNMLVQTVPSTTYLLISEPDTTDSRDFDTGGSYGASAA